jgi:hypothetical protein
MDWAIWTGLAVAVLAPVYAGVVLARHIGVARRALRSYQREVGNELDRVEAAIATTEQAVARANDAGRLEGSLGRLYVALARLEVLRAAFAEASGSLSRVTAVVPRK